MACCLMALSHCLNHYWLTINKVLWHTSQVNVYWNTMWDINPQFFPNLHIDGLLQGRSNSIANASDLRLTSTNPLIYESAATSPREQWVKPKLTGQTMFLPPTSLNAPRSSSIDNKRVIGYQLSPDSCMLHHGMCHVVLRGVLTLPGLDWYTEWVLKQSFRCSGPDISKDFHLPDFQTLHFATQIICGLEENFAKIHLPNWQFYLPLTKSTCLTGSFTFYLPRPSVSGICGAVSLKLLCTWYQSLLNL